MTTYVVLLRGINVGGKNKVPMAILKACLETLGCADVRIYIASGNIILKSDKSAREVAAMIEAALPTTFELDDAIVRALVLTHEQLQAVIDNKPRGFGSKPETYHSDVIFLIGLDTNETMSVFSPREGVDKVWLGDGVIYSQRLSAERTKSRLGKIVSRQLTNR